MPILRTSFTVSCKSDGAFTCIASSNYHHHAPSVESHMSAENNSEADEMLIKRVQQGLSALEIVHRPHLSWPNPRNGKSSEPATALQPAIAILDASFNPPTRAHLALANAPSPKGTTYIARLLLLSVRNADKTLTPGDATLAQRLQMMRLFASEVGPDDTAVGIVDAPAFVAKASILRAAVRASGGEAAAARLVFLQGVDTLERFFAERYYDSPEAMHGALKNFFAIDGDDAAVVCARRIMKIDSAIGEDNIKKEHALLSVAAEVGAGERVDLLDIGEELQRFSSSEVRSKVRAGDEGWRSMVTGSVSDYVVEHNLYHRSN